MRRSTICVSLLLLASPLSAVTAAQLPSLFRGIVVADAEPGVRVVSVEESSQAYEADLRPDDIVLRVQETEIRSIDEFALLSNTLKGRAAPTKLLVFRNGLPRELVLHLYSYPILQAWAIEVVPDHDLRFAQPHTGRDYWMRMGRGFEGAGKDPEALNAYLNALHQMATDRDAAGKAAELFLRVGERRLRDGALHEGLSSLRQALVILEKLFDEPLSDDRLRAVKEQLDRAVAALRDAKPHLLKSRQTSSTIKDR